MGLLSKIGDLGRMGQQLSFHARLAVAPIAEISTEAPICYLWSMS